MEYTVVIHTTSGFVVWRHGVESWDLPWECFRASAFGTVTVYLTRDCSASPSTRLSVTLDWVRA